MSEDIDIKDVDKILPTDDEIIRALWGVAELVAQASRDFAPQGWTGDLKKSIIAHKPEKDGDYFVAAITTGVNDAQTGEDYALKQHDIPLRHYSGYPTLGFNEIGDTAEGKKNWGLSGAEARYWSGYFRAIDAGQYKVFATEFFIRGLEKENDKINKFLDKLFK